MRWQQLFADLQAQFDEEEAAAERAEAASRARAEVGAVRLADRLRGALGSPVVLRCRGAGPVAGVAHRRGRRLAAAGRGTAGGRTSSRRARGARGGRAGPADRRCPSRPGECGAGWTCAGRCAGWPVTAASSRSSWTTAAVLTGTLDRVGADYVELAEHPADQPRRCGGGARGCAPSCSARGRGRPDGAAGPRLSRTAGQARAGQRGVGLRVGRLGLAARCRRGPRRTSAG